MHRVGLTLFKKKSRSKLLEFRTTDEAINNMADLFSEIAQGRLEDLSLHFKLETELMTKPLNYGTVTDRCHQIKFVVNAMMQMLFRAKIERLEHISIYSHSDPDGAEELVQTLIEFINKQETTLRSLTLSSTYILLPTTPHPLSFVFEGLVHFPSLQKITFRLNTRLNDVDLLALWKFVDRHKDTLTDLTIPDHQPTALNGIRFPVLEYLALGTDLGANAPYTPAITALLRCAPSLRVLKLPVHHIYSHEDACAILRAFVSGRKLRVMEMSLENLTPQILFIFARELPNLWELRLKVRGYNDLELHEGSAEERVCLTYLVWSLHDKFPQFCKGIKRQIYWRRPIHLYVKQRGMGFDSCSTALLESIRFTIVLKENFA